MSAIRVLQLHGSDPARWGEQHGESFRDEVRGIIDIRVGLTLSKTNLGTRENVLALAQHHLPVLERFDAALYAELLGIARGAGVTPAEIVVANHYTDLRDLNLGDLERLNAPAAPNESGSDPGGCSAILVDTPAGRVLGQTWDMHGTAEPFAVLLQVPGTADGATVDKVSPTGIPQSGTTLVFSIVGCLGMTGMTSWGLGLTINNLNSTDATVGVVWPALVRKTLRQQHAQGALDCIMGAPIGSGRHYVVADRQAAFAVETSGTKKKIIRRFGPAVGAAYYHTNHCIDEEMKPTCRIPDGSSTLRRYETLGSLSAGRTFDDARAVFDALEPTGLPHNPSAPHDVATCGALVMDLSQRHAVACTGIPGPDADSTLIEVT